MTHDLVTDMLAQLDAQVVRITVTELKENTFYASITMQQNGSEIEIDSRPSDAIALAVRAEAPIFAAEDVIDESAIEFEGEDVNEEEIVDEFKQFLDHVTPDEFAEGERRGLVALGALDLALREREDLVEQLLQALAGQRSAVGAGEVLQHPLLAVGVDERRARATPCSPSAARRASAAR